jgi:hypothetical protein
VSGDLVGLDVHVGLGQVRTAVFSITAEQVHLWAGVVAAAAG